jgi:hypothetical protein
VLFDLDEQKSSCGEHSGGQENVLTNLVDWAESGQPEVAHPDGAPLSYTNSSASGTKT